MLFEMRLHGDIAKRVLYPFSKRAEVGNLLLSPEGLSLHAPSPNRCLFPVLKITPDSVPGFICEDWVCAAVDLVELYHAVSGTSYGDYIFIHLDEAYEPPHCLEVRVRIEKFETGEVEQHPVELTVFREDLVSVNDLQLEYAILIAIPQRVLSLFAVISLVMQFPETSIVHVTVTKTQVLIKVASNEIAETIDLVLNQEEGHCLIGGAATEDPSHFSFMLTVNCREYFMTRVSKVSWLCLSHGAPVLIVVPAPSLGNLHLFMTDRLMNV